jgi:hypothetical protein
VSVDRQRHRYVLDRITAERELQEARLVAARSRRLPEPTTCSDPELSVYVKLAVLAERVGALGGELLELHRGGSAALLDELVRVAGAATAWAESIAPLEPTPAEAGRGAAT